MMASEETYRRCLATVAPAENEAMRTGRIVRTKPRNPTAVDKLLAIMKPGREYTAGELAAQLDLSTTSISNALRFLKSEGLADFEQINCSKSWVKAWKLHGPPEGPR